MRSSSYKSGTALVIATIVALSFMGILAASSPGTEVALSTPSHSFDSLTPSLAPRTYPGASWSAEGDQISCFFGAAVASAGDVNNDGFDDVLVGASRYNGGQPSEGRAFLYHGSAAGLSPSPDWFAEADQAEAWFGYSVASAGDVNNDSYDDVIIGAYQYDTVEPNEGRAFLYMGSAAGLSPAPAWINEADAPDIGGSSASAVYGYAVASAGDVNGDGFGDVIVGAPGYGNDRTNEGRAFLYHGSAAGLSTDWNWTAEADQEYARYGNSVASAGDVNNDGYDDVIVGAYVHDTTAGRLTFAQDGAAFLYHGSAAGLSTEPEWIVESDTKYARYGISVASAGDVNADTYDDVIVGAFLHTAGERSEGKAFLYHGSPSGLSTSPAWTVEGNQADAWYGHSVASAGDLNNDGFDDVVVGAPARSGSLAYEGRVYVYHGSPSGLSSTHAGAADGQKAQAWFGYSVASAGDVNDDGLADILVGAPDPNVVSASEADVGSAFLFHGPGLVVAVTETDHTTTVAESGATDSYQVSIALQPTADVTVTPIPDEQVSVSPTVLTFTPTNWNAAQSVTVTAADDAVFEGDHVGIIAHGVTSADPRFEGAVVVGVRANIADDEVFLDTTNPIVTLTTPAVDEILTSTSVTVSGTASDDVAVQQVELSTDGTNWIPASGTTTWSGTLTLVEGANTIYVRVTDTSGNTATTNRPATVSLEMPGPALSPEVVAIVIGVAAVAIVAVVLAIFFLRRSRGA